MLKTLFLRISEFNKGITERSGALNAALDRNTIKFEIHKVVSEHSNFPQYIELLTSNLTTYCEGWNALIGIAEGNNIDSYIKIVGKEDMPAPEYLKKYYDETIDDIRNNKLMSKEFISKESTQHILRKEVEVLFIKNNVDEKLQNEIIEHLNNSMTEYENTLNQIEKVKGSYLRESEEAVVRIQKIYKKLLDII